MSNANNTPKRRIDKPEPGHFKMRLVRGGPYVPCKINHLDGVWWSTVDGVEHSVHEDHLIAHLVHSIWIYGQPIEKEEYEFLLARTEYYRRSGIAHPSLEPKKAIRLDELPPLF